MPFVPGTFGAATCSSGVHWFDQQAFFGELHRVVRPGGWVALYDHYFIGEMVDVPEFADWLHEALVRYPLRRAIRRWAIPAVSSRKASRRSATSCSRDDIEMTHAQLTDYQLTISNFVDAAEKGVSRAELEAWALESTAPLFAGVETRTVRFLGTITCFRRDV